MKHLLLRKAFRRLCSCLVWKIRLLLNSHDKQITSSLCCCVAASFSQESAGGSEKGCSDLFKTPSPPALCIIHAELTNSSHLDQGLDLNLHVIYHRAVYLHHLNTVPLSPLSSPVFPSAARLSITHSHSRLWWWLLLGAVIIIRGASQIESYIFLFIDV